MELKSGPKQADRMDDLNGYVILAGVCLIFGTLAWAGFTTLAPRLRRNKRRSKKRREERHLWRSKGF